jgi:hypothetical protein
VQLPSARLCLNCEEVHDAQTCPVCASETFAYLTRWVPHSQPECRPVVRPIVAPTMPQRVVLSDGATSLIAFALYRWFKRARTRVEVVSLRKAGELR